MTLKVFSVENGGKVGWKNCSCSLSIFSPGEKFVECEDVLILSPMLLREVSWTIFCCVFRFRGVCMSYVTWISIATSSQRPIRPVWLQVDNFRINYLIILIFEILTQSTSDPAHIFLEKTLSWRWVSFQRFIKLFMNCSRNFSVLLIRRLVVMI